MRLFLALDLPDPSRAELVRVRERLSPTLEGWRWLRPEAIHLTVRFLGEVEESRLSAARAEWRAAAAGVSRFRFRLSTLGCFPPRGAARVLWVGVEDDPPGSLAGLASAVENASVRAGFPPERRAYRPHLTLARARRDARPIRPDPLPVGSGNSVPADGLTLFRSRLEPAGARYTALEPFAFRDG